ncbi:FecR family protein [Gaoshiqia sp. Z1-71]|uniref:FecR family protein n=1 Tax=Gaoshiqia hydrogeniformans TaxID=3290090 RepID=UPI003BF7D626
MKNRQNIVSKFDDLLEKFQAGECSLTELYELQVYFQEEDLSRILRDEMSGRLEQESASSSVVFNSEQLFQKLEQQISLDKRQRKVRRLIVELNRIRVAAIIIFSFLLGGTAVFFLSDPLNEEEVESFCEVVAPLGAKSRVILPDNSVVWLNAGSKLRYSTNFNKNDRNLSLEGEAYFQVTKNKLLPFVVDAFGFQVKAIGTEFNVKAYEEDPTIEATLIEGKAVLAHRTELITSDVCLGPRYKATFYRQDAGFEIKTGQPRLVISPNTDLRPLISWKDDRFFFRSESLNNQESHRDPDVIHQAVPGFSSIIPDKKRLAGIICSRIF